FPPGLTRSENARRHLTVTNAMQVAHVEIQLEPRDDYQRFHIELRTVTGEEVLTRSNVPRQKSGAGFNVSFDLPVSALHAGEYELALKGVFRDTSTRDVGYYYFSVLTP